MANALNTNALKAGLKINIGKTKILSLPPSRGRLLEIDGQCIEPVESFTYLGSKVAAFGGTDEDIDIRLNKALRAFGMMSSIWRNPSISRRLKIRLFKSNVLSVLLYGCSTWRVTKSLTSKLQVFINRCLRNICRIFWPNKISNTELLCIAEMEPIDTWIRRQKWKWIGHTLRKDENCIARKALRWNPVAATTPSVGRPRTTWRTTVDEELKKGTNLVWNQLGPIAQNRIRWRKAVVGALCPPRE